VEVQIVGSDIALDYFFSWTLQCILVSCAITFFKERNEGKEEGSGTGGKGERRVDYNSGLEAR
jgi:hypothetical protein